MHNPHNFSMSGDLKDLLGKLACHPAPHHLTRLRQLIEYNTERAENEPQAFLDMQFLNAIYDRFMPRDEKREHLYLKRFEIPQIVLFDLLINQFPLVSMSHGIVNDAIKHVIAEAPHAVLIDIGIGRGIQAAKLIQSISDATRLKTLTVIGVEPFQEALTHAGEMVAKAAEQAPFKVIFIPVNCLVEKLMPEQLLSALPDEFDKLVVNASLIAHHIPSTAERIAFFDMVRQMQPDALLLTEPDSNHMESDWRQRVENAYTHYGNIFSIIDQLAIGDFRRNGLKAFFAREIQDVVSHSDDQRFERHERTSRWLEYLAKTGFRIGRQFSIGETWKAKEISCRQESPGLLAMRHKGINMISIVHAFV
ncbi:hypothetical protein sS8_4916 [Methylocaldum marinum]|uniref:Uncharacterized protein n=2 Tax=Methylocaldum marinum TaxID=1432792 RepID=A0A250L2P4_9GAMM|nr:hypothetical protein sS8_4916 [Methylocaldum marinum]